MPRGESKVKNNDFKYLIASIVLTCLVSVGLLAGRVMFSDSLRYIFLIWNLVLAIVPLLLAWWLVERLRTQSWLKWQQILITALFISFLPNAFYLITDFVHLRQTNEVNLYFDVIMLSSFVLNGIVLGFISIYMVHRELRKRFREQDALIVIGVVFLLASFATYLGRFTRFNTWDILLRPAGLLFDVSDRFINPSRHTDTYVATISLFVVLSTTYLVFYSSMLTFRKFKA
ncbi:MAG TPA: DUF1361 domain-containing protein [Patescibacteria group bacterium]|nr:DUF1361 domain-containing protein [Patescibacteria group bacterium]